MIVRLTIIVSLLAFMGCGDASETFQSSWPEGVERTWAGPEYWANRLQDWQVRDGRLESIRDTEQHGLRTLHLLTRRLGEGEGTLTMEVTTGALTDPAADDAAAGFLIGAGAGLDYRSAALIHLNHGPGAGFFYGIDASGTLFVRNLNSGMENLADTTINADFTSPLLLQFAANPIGAVYYTELTVLDAETQEVLGVLSHGPVTPDRLVGNVALVTHRTQRWFDDWSVSGSKVEVHDDRTAGPILSTQYTLSRQVMKMTAQLMPIGTADAQTVRLETDTGDGWTEIATADIVTPGFTATFRVADWDDTQDTPYRVAYDLIEEGGSTQTYTWSGTVRRDPVDQEVITVAGFTGNHNVARGFGQPGYEFNRLLWFPHTDIVEAVDAHGTDVLFFSGDQVYEGGSPTYPDREEPYLDLLYKWYLWCWAFRDITRDRPTIPIPDDHDVYQGNLWGQGGRATDVDHNGGYVMPAEWVKMAERIQTSHLPDPYDPTPIDQGIGVYYTDMVYGRIGFAILEDRKFKTGAAGVLPPKEGRPDHITDPRFNPALADKPGLKLLGDRQLVFLEDWASDWRGQDMKVALSQTVFAGLATHHGGDLMRLYADLDSNGWPQSGRNRALHELRRGFAFMLGGDQHLSSMAHHGIDTWNDAGFSFTVPSIANFYPRGWMPEVEGRNRAENMPPHLGEHRDGFNNRVTLFGVTNPTSLSGVSTDVEPLELHDQMPGYGLLHLNKTDRTITMENWPRYVDPDNFAPENQYEGWPKTISMEDNYGRAAVAYLPTLEIEGMTDPVVQIVNEADGEMVYTLRINGTTFRPKVFAQGRYTIHVGDQDNDQMQTFEGVQALSPQANETLTVSF